MTLEALKSKLAAHTEAHSQAVEQANAQAVAVQLLTQLVAEEEAATALLSEPVTPAAQLKDGGDGEE
jgi:hypothetical protein